MSYHAGTIHTVRFSGNGLYLASGADDKMVCVYKLENSPPSQTTAFGAFRTRTGLEEDIQADGEP